MNITIIPSILLILFMLLAFLLLVILSNIVNIVKLIINITININNKIITFTTPLSPDEGAGRAASSRGPQRRLPLAVEREHLVPGRVRPLAHAHVHAEGDGRLARVRHLAPLLRQQEGRARLKVQEVSVLLHTAESTGSVDVIAHG